jgi:hypothetical protein
MVLIIELESISKRQTSMIDFPRQFCYVRRCRTLVLGSSIYVTEKD